MIRDGIVWLRATTDFTCKLFTFIFSSIRAVTCTKIMQAEVFLPQGNTHFGASSFSTVPG